MCVRKIACWQSMSRDVEEKLNITAFLKRNIRPEFYYLCKIQRSAWGLRAFRSNEDETLILRCSRPFGSSQV